MPKTTDDHTIDFSLRTAADGVRRQLTLDVDLSPALAEEDDPQLVGTLKITGTFLVAEDLNAGDRLIIQIAREGNGEAVAHGVARVTMPAFREIEDQGQIVGTERAHTAKLVR